MVRESDRDSTQYEVYTLDDGESTRKDACTMSDHRKSEKSESSVKRGPLLIMMRPE